MILISFKILLCVGVIGNTETAYRNYVSPTFNDYNDPLSRTYCNVVCCTPFKRTGQEDKNNINLEQSSNVSAFINDLKSEPMYNKDRMIKLKGEVCRKRARIMYDRSVYDRAPSDWCAIEGRSTDISVRKHTVCNQQPGQIPNNFFYYYTIGFDRNDLTDGVPDVMVLICFDHGLNNEKHSPLWARHFIRREKDKEEDPSRYFRENTETGTSVITAYKSSLYERGHLAPIADFSLKIEKQTTQYYINVVPQASYFNQGEWKRLESGIRQFANYEKWVIYTGTFGESGVLQTTPKKGASKILPIPLFFYKIVLDLETHKAVAFIGINDIEEIDSTEPSGYRFIRNMCTRNSGCDITKIFGFKNAKLENVFCCKADVLLNYLEELYKIYLKNEPDFRSPIRGLLEGFECPTTIDQQ